MSEEQTYNFERIISVTIERPKLYCVKILKNSSPYRDYIDTTEVFVNGLRKYLENDEQFLKINNSLYTNLEEIESIAIKPELRNNGTLLIINYKNINGSTVNDSVFFGDKQSAELAFMMLNEEIKAIDLRKE